MDSRRFSHHHPLRQPFAAVLGPGNFGQRRRRRHRSNSMTTISTTISTTTSRRISTTNLTTTSTMTRATRRPRTTRTAARKSCPAKRRMTSSHAGSRSADRTGGRGDPQPLDRPAPNWHHPRHGAGQSGRAYSCRGDDRLRLDSAFSAFHRHRPHGPVGVRSFGRSRHRGHGGPFSCLTKATAMPRSRFPSA